MEPMNGVAGLGEKIPQFENCCLGGGEGISYGKKDRYQAILSRFASEHCPV
jgi:hypothetical protein